MPSHFDLAAIRAQFPALQQQVNDQPLIYLDNAATTQKPLAVLRAMDEYYRRDNANVHRAAPALSGRATRPPSKQLGSGCASVSMPTTAAKSSGLVAPPGAINLVAYSWGQSNLKPGDGILLSVLEHHANIVPWQQVAARTGAVLRVIPLTTAGELDLAAFHALLLPALPNCWPLPTSPMPWVPSIRWLNSSPPPKRSAP